MTFLTILGVTKILCSFKLALEGKIGKEIPESSRLKSNDFALSDAEDNTYGLLNRGGIADLLLLRTLFEAGFDARCFQLVQQSYTKSELLVIMRLLESNIA